METDLQSRRNLQTRPNVQTGPNPQTQPNVQTRPNVQTGPKLVFLPFRFKWAGWGLVALATGMLAAYLLLDFRFRMPVFAVLSSFFETKFFVSFQTNFADELIMLCYLAGFFLLVFSRERTENAEMDQKRARAIFLSIRYTMVFLAFSILFVYGTGFIGALLINMYSPFIIYLLVFYLSLCRAD